MDNIDLSLVIPCYNEGIKLIKNIEEIDNYMKLNMENYNYEIIIVNDGSCDDTLKICKQIEANNNNLKVMSYDKNRGKGYAVKQGISISVGSLVIFMDADLSTKLSAIRECCDNLKFNNVVVGSRRHKESNLIKKQGLIRQLIGKSCSLLTNIIIPLNIPDTQCGFKGFDGQLARDIVLKQTLDGFSFDVELLYIAKLRGNLICEIPVEWENDSDSKVGIFNTSVNFFIDLFKIRSKKKLYIKK